MVHYHKQSCWLSFQIHNWIYHHHRQQVYRLYQQHWWYYFLSSLHIPIIISFPLFHLFIASPFLHHLHRPFLSPKLTFLTNIIHQSPSKVIKMKSVRFFFLFFLLFLIFHSLTIQPFLLIIIILTHHHPVRHTFQ